MRIRCSCSEIHTSKRVPLRLTVLPCLTSIPRDEREKPMIISLLKSSHNNFSFLSEFCRDDLALLAIDWLIALLQLQLMDERAGLCFILAELILLGILLKGRSQTHFTEHWSPAEDRWDQKEAVLQAARLRWDRGLRQLRNLHTLLCVLSPFGDNP